MLVVIGVAVAVVVLLLAGSQRRSRRHEGKLDRELEVSLRSEALDLLAKYKDVLRDDHAFREQAIKDAAQAGCTGPEISKATDLSPAEVAVAASWGVSVAACERCHPEPCRYPVQAECPVCASAARWAELGGGATCNHHPDVRFPRGRPAKAVHPAGKPGVGKQQACDDLVAGLSECEVVEIEDAGRALADDLGPRGWESPPELDYPTGIGRAFIDDLASRSGGEDDS